MKYVREYKTGKSMRYLDYIRWQIVYAELHLVMYTNEFVILAGLHPMEIIDTENNNSVRWIRLFDGKPVWSVGDKDSISQAEYVYRAAAGWVRYRRILRIHRTNISTRIYDRCIMPIGRTSLPNYARSFGINMARCLIDDKSVIE